MKKIFPELPEMEKKEIISRLIDAMTKSNQAYYDAQAIIQNFDMKGGYKDIKLFNKHYHE